MCAVIKGETIGTPRLNTATDPAPLVNHHHMLASIMRGSGGGKAGNARANDYEVENYIIRHARLSSNIICQI